MHISLQDTNNCKLGSLGVACDVISPSSRSSSQGIHLLFARIGAILGTNLFGLFIHINPTIPILLVACLLLVGSLASLPLPKTTRKTVLK